MIDSTGREPSAASRIAANANAWMARNKADGGVCDFCCHLLGDQAQATYITATPIITIRRGVIDYQDPYWAACPTCDPVVQQGDAASLAQHVWSHRDADRIGIPAERLNTAVELYRLTELYRAFYHRDPVRHDGEVRGED